MTQVHLCTISMAELQLFLVVILDYIKYFVELTADVLEINIFIKYLPSVYFCFPTTRYFAPRHFSLLSFMAHNILLCY